MNGGAADNMTGVGLKDLDVFIDRVPGVVFDADEVVHGALGIIGVI